MPGTGSRLQQNVCAFWLGDSCYGVDISLVGEVVEVDDVVPVPLTPEPVKGIFSLRGTPVALVDLARLLDLPEATSVDEARPGRRLVSLVLRTEQLVIGLLIRRMEMVVTRGKGIFSPAEASEGEHPMVAGFLELAERGGLTITVLATQAILDRIDTLKFADTTARG